MHPDALEEARDLRVLDAVALLQISHALGEGDEAEPEERRFFAGDAAAIVGDEKGGKLQRGEQASNVGAGGDAVRVELGVGEVGERLGRAHESWVVDNVWPSQWRAYVMQRTASCCCASRRRQSLLRVALGQLSGAGRHLAGHCGDDCVRSRSSCAPARCDCSSYVSGRLG